MPAVCLKTNLWTSRGWTIAVVLSLVVCLGAAPQSQPAAAPAPHPPGQKLILEGVKNFGQVTPMLYRGGQPSSEGFDALAKMGVNIVVDGRLSGRDKERKVVEKAGMQYVTIPWHCLLPRDETFARFLAVLRANPDKKVFVHCRYGDDRTGMMVASYRMAVEGWTAEEARQEMEYFGFKHLVCPSLALYEKSFPEHVKKNPAFKAATNPPPATN